MDADISIDAARAYDAVLLSGPTASGKSAFVMALAERMPIEIISVDSSQVYRGFDVGAAKPDAAARARVPHHLLDIREPQQGYSAGEFVQDALAAIELIRSRGRLPVLVGGTMLYFNALTRGLAKLPAADPAVRAAIDADAVRLGWPAMHSELQHVDPQAAARIHPNDPQRIQRALEVFRVSGVPISQWQQQTEPRHRLRFLRSALVPADRQWLHERIAARFEQMMANGFLAEVAALRSRADLPAEAPALRAVGYRQLWGHLAGEYGLAEAVERALVATRHLAKRQLTWVNADPLWQQFDPSGKAAVLEWMAALQQQLPSSA